MEDHRLVIEQHHPLIHAGGDLSQLVVALPQSLHLLGELLVLVVDAPQEGEQLLVDIVGEGIIQIQGIDGLTTCRDSLSASTHDVTTAMAMSSKRAWNIQKSRANIVTWSADIRSTVPSARRWAQ